MLPLGINRAELFSSDMPLAAAHRKTKTLPSGIRLPGTGLEHLAGPGAADVAGSQAELESTAGLESNGQEPAKVCCMARCIGS